MFKWLKSLFQKKEELNIIYTPIGFNHMGTIGKQADHTSACLNCGETWDHRKNNKTISYNVNLYQRCSKCLDITQIKYKQTTINQEIHIEGLEDVPR